jgi:flagellar hook-length control protein FliK
MQMTMNEMSAPRAAPKSTPSNTKTENNKTNGDDKSFQDSLDAKIHVDRENQKAADNQQNGTNVATYAPATTTPVADAQQEIAFVLEVAKMQANNNQDSTLQQIMQELTQTLQQTDTQVNNPVMDLIQQIEDAAAQQTQSDQGAVKVEVQVNAQVSLQILTQEEAGSKAAANLSLKQTEVVDPKSLIEKPVLPAAEKPAPVVEASTEKAAAAQIQPARPDFLSQLNMIQNQKNEADTTLILNQISDKLKTTMDAGKDTVKIQMQPENMGKVDVRIVRGSDGVQFYFTADTLSTSRALQASLNQLHQSLMDAGVKVGNMSVSYQGQPGQQNNQGQSQRKNVFSFFGQDDADLAVEYSNSSALSALDTRA